MLTALMRAEVMALQVLIFARLHNDRVVTHDVVDGVMSRDADTEQGKANKETVRRIIRARAVSENVRVIFTEAERYWAIREQLHHMSGGEIHALGDSITEGGDDDPRGWDKALNDAISVHMSNRLAPARLWDCKPVSIRLWGEPRPRLAGDEGLQHARIVDSGTPEIIPTRDALAEIDTAMTQPGKDAVRRVSESWDHSRIVYRDSARGTVDLRPLVKGQAPAGREQRPNMQEPFGPVDGALLASYAEMHAAVDNGTAIPVRADMVRPGMDAITIAYPEGHPVDIVTHHNGPGTVCVNITGGGGGTYAPDFHLMVTVDSLTRLYGSTFVVRPPAVSSAPAPDPADDAKARRRAAGFAAKWWAEQHTEEPTDEALRATFVHCVKPPRPELYPAIREAIAAEMPPTAAAPLFAALAAYEAVRDASLSRSPHDLHTVACHLETMPLAAPTGLHPELREARDAAEEACEALRIADSLTTRIAAYDKARTVVERARAVVLAVAPRAHRMHGTDMPATAEEIRTAALAYNAVEGAPEELSAVESGTPTVRVHCRSDSGTGWTVIAKITAGVGSPIGHIPAHSPIVVTFRKRDGRENAAEITRRMLGHMFRVAVPVEYVTDRRP